MECKPDVLASETSFSCCSSVTCRLWCEMYWNISGTLNDDNTWRMGSVF